LQFDAIPGIHFWEEAMARILVIDDDKSIVDLMRYMLAKDGHQVSIAQDGKAGLAMAQQEKPDLIILDVMMPEVDGFTVSGSLFKDAALRRIPILILTAKGSTRDIFELVPNVKEYMQKPFDPADLLKNIKKLLQSESRAA
jgi:DNA-binding response OmpR family regulator